jgi:hypothetical protein
MKRGVLTTPFAARSQNFCHDVHFQTLRSSRVIKFSTAFTLSELLVVTANIVVRAPYDLAADTVTTLEIHKMAAIVDPFSKADDARQKLEMTRHDGKGMALMYDGSTNLLTPGQAIQSARGPQNLKLLH